MPGIEIGLSQGKKKKKRDPSANLFLIKYLTCQNYRQCMFLCLSTGAQLFLWAREEWVVLGSSFPGAVLTDPIPAQSSPAPLNLARFLCQIPWPLLEGGGLMRHVESWSVPILMGMGDAAPPYLLITGLRSFQNRKERFCNEKS